jgi:hypothetical protein
MTKMSLSLLAAGVMAVASVAQADAIFYPDGTMVELGDTGADTLALTSSDSLSWGYGYGSMAMDSSIDTSVLGAGPAVSTIPSVEYVYVQPNINFDRSVAVSQMHSHRMVQRDSHVRHQAAATFDVPARAGEASTMTGGAPNMLTSNDHLVVGSAYVPYSSVTIGQPYYVMSY